MTTKPNPGDSPLDTKQNACCRPHSLKSAFGVVGDGPSLLWLWRHRVRPILVFLQVFHQVLPL